MTTRTPDTLYTRPLRLLSSGDVETFGIKNTALGEMIRHMGIAGLWAPQGFAVSTHAFDRFVQGNGLRERIAELVGALTSDDSTMAKIGAMIRNAILASDVPADVKQEIVAHYKILLEDVADWPLPVAVLASIVPKRLAAAAFGGREPASHVVQNTDALIDAVRRSYAALYSDRAIAYRFEHHVSHDAFKISIAIQTMMWANAGGRARDAEEADDEILAISSFLSPLRRVG